MSSSKTLLQNQLRKWKSAASQLITSEEIEADDNRIELEPSSYAICKRLAEAQGTTVNAVVHYMIEQYASSRPQDSMFQATLEQRDRNPLLQLDGLTKHGEKNREEEMV
ncbi:hypothetical protein O9H85_31260 [Paenibacillus filicis]|uniref:Uncharacterized protein n=1 Tax=Paenibacillus gyeongsangnamensis TaxID=3388067 RepID=A0ABT4QIQ9_9BACL|nr:hypothetical protein [Paenibacillus filicis]MCZ8516765.1 hypothetical protein [Paenibacillus filicis]